MRVRFINATVSILQEQNTLDESGDYISEFVPIETIEGDVQPHSMTEDEIKTYGISTIRGNVKKFFYNGLHPNVKAGNRASVSSAFTGQTDVYNIMPINAWSQHGVCLLVPIENEAEEVEPTEPTDNTDPVENDDDEQD